MGDSVKYPDHLNPFGDEDESNNEYPDHLDPFGDDDNEIGNGHGTHTENPMPTVEDYDDSLNPFGDVQDDGVEAKQDPVSNGINLPGSIGNPFGDEENTNQKSCDPTEYNVTQQNHSNKENDVTTRISETAQPQSLEPPKPLPRTKSLLKKELALKRRQQEQQESYQKIIAEKASTLAEKTNLESDRDKIAEESPSNVTSTSNDEPVGSCQRKKNKRVPPPVPVNFKRQVIGSLEPIEAELNAIGDELAEIEKDFLICQEKLKAPDATGRIEFSETKCKFIELIQRKNSLSRRQKELMFKKRELKLDQIHSDVEYELRMIVDKQPSTRTPEDEAKEKELLQKLVEIVEEKSDIVENSNRDTLSDNRDIEEAFNRLNIGKYQSEKGLSDSSTPPPLPQSHPKVHLRKENWDKISLNKIGKFATLIPKSNTIKGTMKIKRKHLFKKRDNSQTPPIGNDKKREQKLDPI